MRATAWVIATLLVSSVAISPAYAQESSTSEEPVYGEEGDLVVEGQEGFLVDPSPAGCVGKANNPHKTDTRKIKGVAQTGCNYSVSLKVTSQLWRKRWWGYEKVGSKGNNSRYTNLIKASGLFNGCQNNWWRTEGEHWSYEASGTYYRHTMRYNEVTRC